MNKFFEQKKTIVEELRWLYRLGLIERTGEVAREETNISLDGIEFKQRKISQDFADGYKAGRALMMEIIATRLLEVYGQEKV